MPYRDKSFAADAAISPSKIDPSKRRVFFDDFEGADAADASLRLGWSKVGTGTTKIEQDASYRSALKVAVTGGSSVSESLYGDMLFSSYRNISFRCRVLSANATSHAAAYFGLTTGQTIATQIAQAISFVADPDYKTWRVLVGSSGTAANHLDTGIVLTAATTFDLSLLIEGTLVTAQINGTTIVHNRPAPLLRTWRPFVLHSADHASSEVVDYVLVSEDREDRT